jgi:hypothetical protein
MGNAKHLAGRQRDCSWLLPVLATWECCVSLCENSGKCDFRKREKQYCTLCNPDVGKCRGANVLEKAEVAVKSMTWRQLEFRYVPRTTASPLTMHSYSSYQAVESSQRTPARSGLYMICYPSSSREAPYHWHIPYHHYTCYF